MNHINSLHVTPSVDVFTSIAVNDSGDDSDDPEWLDGLVAKKIKKVNNCYVFTYVLNIIILIFIIHQSCLTFI